MTKNQSGEQQTETKPIPKEHFSWKEVMAFTLIMVLMSETILLFVFSFPPITIEEQKVVVFKWEETEGGIHNYNLEFSDGTFKTVSRQEYYSVDVGEVFTYEERKAEWFIIPGFILIFVGFFVALLRFPRFLDKYDEECDK